MHPATGQITGRKLCAFCMCCSCDFFEVNCKSHPSLWHFIETIFKSEWLYHESFSYSVWLAFLLLLSSLDKLSRLAVALPVMSCRRSVVFVGVSHFTNSVDIDRLSRGGGNVLLLLDEILEVVSDTGSVVWDLLLYLETSVDSAVDLELFGFWLLESNLVSFCCSDLTLIMFDGLSPLEFCDFDFDFSLVTFSVLVLALSFTLEAALSVSLVRETPE